MRLASQTLRRLSPALLAAAMAFSALAQTPAPATSTAVVVPPAPLLPDHFGAWQTTGPADNALTLTPDVAKELLFQRTDAKKYTAEGATATVSAVQLADSTGAYAAWTLLRTPEMHPCAGGNSLGVDCAVSAGKLLFWQGNTLVQIAPSGAKAISAGSFNDLVTGLPKPMGAKGAPPLLPTRIPTEGLQKESTRYAVGPATYAAEGGLLSSTLIDFTKSPEILTTHYAGIHGVGELTAIFYPTPTIAGVAQHKLEAALADGSLPALMRNGTPVVRRSGPIVALASNGFSEKEAAKIAGGIKYEAELTWNKPEGYMDQFTIQHTSNVIVQIMILVITVVCAALVLGLVFGGGRAWLRKLQGKPVSSLGDMEVISLNLRGPAPKIQP